MTTLYPLFYSRQFQVAPQPAASMSVDIVRKHVQGGPKLAEITAAGNENALLGIMLTGLRRPVEIYDSRLRNIWWGYAHEVEVSIGAIKIRRSLDPMANRIAVAYTANTPTGAVRRTTDWAGDALSMASYGIKELLASGGASSDDQAVRQRDQLLRELAYPLKDRDGFGDEDGRATAKIVCRGWFDTLAWQHAGLAAVVQTAEYFPEPENVTFNIGDVANATYYQEFTFPGTATDAHQPISHRCKVARVGAPMDNLVWEIWSLTGSTPTALLASWTQSGEKMATSHTIYDLEPVSQGVCYPGSTYALLVKRSGAVDPVNYYRVTAHSAAGYSGALRVWNGAAWVAVGTAADFLFRLKFDQLVSTSDKIKAIALAGGQFLTGIDLEVASGVWTTLGRSGDQTARKLIDDLLASATATGRRMTATVTDARRLRIFAEPLLGERDLYFTRAGRVVDLLNAPVVASDCPVGYWLRDKDVLIEGGAQFVEESEYVPSTNRYVPRARGADNPYALGVRAG